MSTRSIKARVKIPDYSDKSKLSLSGGTMTGPLILSGSPTVALSAATKGYVDTAISNAITTAIGGSY